MKNSKLVRAAAAMLCAAMALAGLSACGSSSSSAEGSSTSSDGQRTEPKSESNTNGSDNSQQKTKPTEPEPRTFSEIFNGKQSIWFASNEITKDAHFRYVLVFDHGKVTTYPFSWGTLGDQLKLVGGYGFADLRGVPMNQVLAKVQEMDRGSFDKQVELGKNLNQKEHNDKAVAEFQAMEGHYPVPVPTDFKLSVQTDSTGNNVISEKLVWKRTRCEWHTNVEGVHMEQEETEEPVEFKGYGSSSGPGGGTQTVYDKNFTGTSGLVRMSSTGEQLPTIPEFDRVGAPGVIEDSAN
ncbi:hypothetical protein [Bifidobacterium sp. ESL0745]|uniref:hypothetical protein n=1 Tax=Bifidobacterium sp. ESL0745 TaxID=2983226 RepID=UPI0023F677B6|nr:hypothetical protein [Bifidobacterium sp. ESL0745]MDF7664880.1 hypothetical protein [Bifidobacterium sp. ESL0745]